MILGYATSYFFLMFSIQVKSQLNHPHTRTQKLGVQYKTMWLYYEHLKRQHQFLL